MKSWNSYFLPSFRFFCFNDKKKLFSVVDQYYEAQVYDVFVIKGNSAIFKCNIPSFVADHVEITEWTDTNGGSYFIENSFGTKKKNLIF